jgi:mono/diheme cytochrome c family protein
MTTSTANGIFLVRATIAIAAIVGALLTAPLAQVRDRDPRWAAPPEAAARVNPLLNRSDATAGGEKLFQQRCATCHGEDGRGTAKAPDLNGREVQAQTDGELYWKLSTGNTHAGMPAFSFLPEPQRWQLVLALRRRALMKD